MSGGGEPSGVDPSRVDVNRLDTRREDPSPVDRSREDPGPVDRSREDPGRGADGGGAPHAGAHGARRSWGERAREIAGLLREGYATPYRRTMARAQRDEDDLFMVIVLAEALGVPNPVSYHTVELLPVVYDEVHDWHRRMGMDRSPLEHVSCC